jgi:hypothetical protein
MAFIAAFTPVFPALAQGFTPPVPPEELAAPTEDPAIPGAEETESLPPSGPVPLRAASAHPLAPPEAGSAVDAGFSAFFGGLPPLPARRFQLPLARAMRDGRGDFWFTPAPVKTVAFAGFETTGRTHYASAGFKRALNGHLDRPGYRVLVMLGAKLHEVDPALGTSRHRLQAARLLAGHEWHWSGLAVSIMAGGSFIPHPPEAQAQTRRAGTAGVVAMIELWQHWSGTAGASVAPRYTALTALVDQAEGSGFIRLRQGFALTGKSWSFGPEAAFSAGETRARRGVIVQDGWRHARLGAMISDIPLGDTRLTLGGGIEWREHHEAGGYLQASAYRKF